jgi:hypothetical protein
MSPELASPLHKESHHDQHCPENRYQACVVYAWLLAGGLLTAVQVLISYIDPSFPIPAWVAPVVIYIGGFVAAYIKKSVAVVPTPEPVAPALVLPADTILAPGSDPVATTPAGAVAPMATAPVAPAAGTPTV